MAHFAKVVDDIVVNVIVAEEDFFDTFVDNSPGEWIQTSYNTMRGIHYTQGEDGSHIPSDDQSKALRKNFASIGYSYDRDRDAFVPPRTYPSWSLDEFECMWKAPIQYPDDDNIYEWNEENQSWNLIES